MKNLFCCTVLLAANMLFSQSYAPAAGQTGSTAIAADSSLFVSWAAGCTVTRGLQDIANPAGEFASFGSDGNAIGAVDGTPVSLGDRGSAVLTFNNPIGNGAGFDFAVFENSFSDVFLELAFVEVSSDGVHFFRFPSHSQTQTATQTESFGETDCRRINNLAGKYRVNFGTPFDISDLPDDAGLDKNRITHLKIIDVVGSIDPAYASYDSFGNIINDPYATPFVSSGFDLDAVGVIHQTLSAEEFSDLGFALYPNPVDDVLFITGDTDAIADCYDISGKLIYTNRFTAPTHTIDVSAFKPGIYLLQLRNEKGVAVKKIVVR